MKTIAIIGAGIAGLRAALELSKNENINIVILDKAVSVGGRVATRRFEHSFVNHGATHFEDIERVLSVDSDAQKFAPAMQFSNEATSLPKLMREHLLNNPRIKFRFKNKVNHLSVTGQISSDMGKNETFDHVLVTAPVNQIREMMQLKFLEEVRYSKKILLIGEIDEKSNRIEMSSGFAEENFFNSDSEIQEAASLVLNQETERLDVKKWLYAQVVLGVELPYLSYTPNITFAGDAFDPSGKYNLAGAWLSGFKAAQFISNEIKEIT